MKCITVLSHCVSARSTPLSKEYVQSGVTTQAQQAYRQFHSAARSIKQSTYRYATSFNKANSRDPYLTSCSSGLQYQPIRRFNIHEYQAVDLMTKHCVPTPRSKVASTPAEAESAAEALAMLIHIGTNKRTLELLSGGPDFVVKAQVLAGGRGKGTFTSGFVGGVHTCISALEARSLTAKMLNQRLVTKQTGQFSGGDAIRFMRKLISDKFLHFVDQSHSVQTISIGPEGKPCSKVLISERLFLRREAYFAILMDRQSQGPVMVASPAGGMDIEKVAAERPSEIFKETIDIIDGVKDEQILRLARQMGFSSKSAIDQACLTMRNLYEMFLKYDCTLVEINPIAETHDSRILCVDAKLNFDDNSLYRQPLINSLRDPSQEDSREVEAEGVGLNYIGLDGEIGCLVNGAGLAMATMDAIKLNGGSPANFLDVGGGATKDQVTAAFKLLNADPHVKAILVNIFGGIMKCDVIALGIIAAATTLGLKKPVVVRLAGTNVKEAKKLFEDSGMRMLTADDLGEAAQKAVKVVHILKMAEDAQVNVSFELPL